MRDGSLALYGDSVVYRPQLEELGEGIVNLGRIIVLGAVKVVAAGTHESLYQQCPLYQALWGNQRRSNGELRTLMGRTVLDAAMSV